jgi:hypothetical protein
VNEAPPRPDPGSSPGQAPLPQGEGEYAVSQLRGLIADCLSVWGVQGRISPCAEGVEIVVAGRSFLLQRAPVDMRPVRWLLQTPERRAANRPPRAAPSIVAVLTGLRNALGAEGGNRLRIGAAAR